MTLNIVNENTPEQDEQYERNKFEAANAPKFTTPPPYAQDFTDNPFDKSEPLDVSEKEPTFMARARARLKITHDTIKSHSSPLNDSKIKLAEDGSEIAANIINGGLGILMTLLGEEYTVITPTKERLYAVVYPVSRIVMRHSKIAGEISPDYIDASQALKAAADIVREMSSGIRHIRWMKRNGYEFAGFEPEPTVPGTTSGASQPAPEPRARYRYTEPEPLNELGGTEYQPGVTYPPEVAGGGTVDGRTDGTSGSGSPNGPVSTALGTVNIAPLDHLNPDERRKHDALLELTRRDVQSRRRRAGFLR